MTKIVVILKIDVVQADIAIVGPFDDIPQAFEKFQLIGLKLKNELTTDLPAFSLDYALADNSSGYNMVEFRYLVDFETATDYMSESN